MPHTFTLHEDAWLRDGPIFASGQVTGYRVGGMPDGKTARIANFGAHRIGTTGASCESTATTHRPVGPATTKVWNAH